MNTFLDSDLCANCGNQFPEGQVCDACRKFNDEAYRLTIRDAAVEFLDRCSLVPNPDAVDQLVEAFLPALRIICERDYHPNGATWRKAGWRGIVREILKNADRIRDRSWLRSVFDDDSPLDLANYAGMYYRLKNEGPPWGDWGEPGSGDR